MRLEAGVDPMGERGEHHLTDIVPVAGVLRARVAETDDEPGICHRRDHTNEGTPTPAPALPALMQEGWAEAGVDSLVATPPLRRDRSRRRRR